VTTSAPDDEESPVLGIDGAAAFDLYHADRPGTVRGAGDLELRAAKAPMPSGTAQRGRTTTDAATLSAAEGEYAPFKTGATKPARQEDVEESDASQQAVSVEQTVRRLSVLIERCAKGITPEVRRQFARLPEKVRARFVAAVKDLCEKTAELK
jgi:hypothetical protein